MTGLKRRPPPGSGEPSLAAPAYGNVSTLEHTSPLQHAAPLFNNPSYTPQGPAPTSKIRITSDTSPNSHNLEPALGIQLALRV